MLDLQSVNAAEFALQITMSAMLGGLVGVERERNGQFAGLRTMILVGVGACLLMQVSLNMPMLFKSMGAETAVRADPARIASYAIASMGFLGGGAIIKGKGTVRGLTTAASLWLVTAFGLAIGAGFWTPALIAALVCLLVLHNFSRIKNHFVKFEYTVLTLEFAEGQEHLKRIRSLLLANPKVKILFTNYFHDLENASTRYALRIFSHEDTPWGVIINDLKTLPGLVRISWTESDVP